MDLNDRLRDHLHAQSSELHPSTEGPAAVRARSRKRKQQRAGGVALAAVLAVLLAGGWVLGRDGQTSANLATEGDDAAGTSEADSSVVAQTTAPAPDLETALPEPGSALRFGSVDTAGAPGGYNVWQSGRANGLYYVLSTAPGVTWDDLGEGEDLLRNDTVYTYDGQAWTQSSAGDRYISTIDSAETGLLYTVSTGTPAGPALELGRSTSTGQDWAWTELDLTSIFGADRSAWPAYTVQHATRGDELLVVVHSRPVIDAMEAVELAAANGADLDPRNSEAIYVDTTGISWVPSSPTDPCSASLDEALSNAWDGEPEGPEFDFDRPLTDAERAELDAFIAAQNVRSQEIYADALQAVARVPGCAAFVKCTAELDELRRAADARAEAVFGGDLDTELTDEQAAELDRLYGEFEGQMNTWAAETGCDEALPYFAGEEAEGPSSEYVAWADLGVTPPASWTARSAAFHVEGDVVTNIGDPFGAQNGFLAGVRTTDDDWSVTFDMSNYLGSRGTEAAFTVWTSPDADTWNSSPASSFAWTEPATLANGTWLDTWWGDDTSQLRRTSPDGETVGLALDDLAADLDTDDYHLMNVRSGEYGAVAWAVRWRDADDAGAAYDSIVLYSPDGIDWGVTEVTGLEVVDVIVGVDDVIVFLNDPARTEGTPQPILVGRVE